MVLCTSPVETSRSIMYVVGVYLDSKQGRKVISVAGTVIKLMSMNPGNNNYCE